MHVSPLLLWRQCTNCAVSVGSYCCQADGACRNCFAAVWQMVTILDTQSTGMQAIYNNHRITLPTKHHPLSLFIVCDVATKWDLIYPVMLTDEGGAPRWLPLGHDKHTLKRFCAQHIIHRCDKIQTWSSIVATLFSLTQYLIVFLIYHYYRRLFYKDSPWQKIDQLPKVVLISDEIRKGFPTIERVLSNGLSELQNVAFKESKGSITWCP